MKRSLVAALFGAGGARARRGAAAAAGPAPASRPPGVEARAEQELRRMGEFLAKLPRFAIEAEETFDEIEAGEPRRQLTNVRRAAVERPDRLAADATGDTLNRAAWYDGETLSILDKEHNTYATVEAPATIDATLDMLEDTYGIVLPLADLLYSDPYRVLIAGVTYGRYLGLHQAAGVPCHHLVFAQDTIEWQIWIDAGDQPLPRKLVITYVLEEGEPQYSATIRRWNLGPDIPRGALHVRGAGGRAEGRPRGEGRPAGRREARRRPAAPKEDGDGRHNERFGSIARRRGCRRGCSVSPASRLRWTPCRGGGVRSTASTAAGAAAAGRARARAARRAAPATGNSASRSTTAQGTGGRPRPGTKNVTKSGDQVNVNSNVQSSTGASKSTQKTYDDGRRARRFGGAQHAGHQPPGPDLQLGRQGRALRLRRGVRGRGHEPLRAEGLRRRLRRAGPLRVGRGRGCPRRRATATAPWWRDAPTAGRCTRRASRTAPRPTPTTATRTTCTAAPTIVPTPTTAWCTTATCRRRGACITRPPRSARSLSRSWA